jgi:Ni,Fe-hydrogenase III small subunit/ferredoxin
MPVWVLRGLGGGVVTTRYPRAPEPAPPGGRCRVEVVSAPAGDRSLEDVCPTRAITVRDDAVRLDRGRCILCGDCVRVAPERFRLAETQETASRHRGGLLSPAGEGDPPRPALANRSRPLRRSVHIRHVDAGSDGSEEWEIAALTNPYYDMQRLGLFMTAAPRHADVLLVTGGVTRPMRAPLERAFAVMPGPKAVVAAGTDACSGGLAGAGGEVAGGVGEVLPVDVWIPGSPPSPIALLHGLLLAAGIVREQVR